MRSWLNCSILSSLRTRLVVLVLLAVIPALGLILYSASEQRRSAITEARANTLRLVRLAANNQKQMADGTRQLLTVLAQLPIVRQGKSPDCDQLLADLLRQYPIYANFSVLDAQGKTICSGLPYSGSVGSADLNYFKSALQTRKFVVGDYQIGRISKKPTISFAFPILNKAGQVESVGIASLDLNQWNRLAAQVKLPKDGVLSVIDQRGTLLVRYPEPEKWLGKSIPPDAFNVIKRAGGEGVNEITSLDSVRRIFAFAPLGDDPLNPDGYIRVGVPLSTVFDNANGLLMNNLLGLGAVTILALVAAWVGGDAFLIRQVQSLVQTAQTLGSGRLDARTHVSYTSGELGQLARAIDEMATALAAREKAIASLNQDMKTLFELIPIGILITQDSEFTQVRANPAFAQILGLSPESNISSLPINAFYSGYKILRDGKEIQPEEFPLQYAAIHKTEVRGTEIDIVRDDGKIINLFGYAAPLLDEQGNARGSVAAFLDISDRLRAEVEREQLLQREKAAREAAEVANRVKDEFLGILSHELRTPLNPILGWTKLLRTGKLNLEKTAIALETIERNAKLQIQLVEDLLDISHILQGNFTLNLSYVDLPSITVAAIETLRLATEAKSIPIVTEFTPGFKPFLADASRLQQVVWNLLSNALKFTPAGGQVTIKLESGGNYAQIQVSDTGRGISPEFLPYIFDIFRQADSATTRQFGGLGLGLAIVRHVVEMHGGTVNAYSLGENQGSTFTVKLPQVYSPPKFAEQEISSHNAVNLNGIRVLVVDDEADIRDLVVYLIEESGAEVIATASAKDALQILKQSPVDVLVCDIAMPNMDGYMLIQQVRAWSLEKGGKIPAIALSAYPGEFNQRKAISVGFQRHLSKPVDPKDLVQVIASLL
jgi:signal transduction histidine kinase/CheY-like chemotaxis protein